MRRRAAGYDLVRGATFAAIAALFESLQSGGVHRKPKIPKVAPHDAGDA